MLELDLRSCNIQTLHSKIFSGMSALESLYLGNNNIVQVETNAFYGLHNIVHIDLSSNFYYNQVTGQQMMTWGSVGIFENLTNLASLDFSNTKISSANVLTRLGPTFQRLSLCHSGVTRLRGSTFQNTDLRILDVSGNNGILADSNCLQGIEDTLEILFADSVGLQTLDMLFNFEKLEILKVSNNEITGISPIVSSSWQNMQIIDLDSNRIASWSNPIYSLMPNLKVLSLQINHINMISEEMVKDIEKVFYVGLSGNFFFCNCHSREFIDVAFINEVKRSTNNRTLEPISNNEFWHSATSFHVGFERFNTLVQNRGSVIRNCTTSSCKIDVSDVELSGKFLIFDYTDEAYSCFRLDEGVSSLFYEQDTCSHNSRDNIEDIIERSTNKLLILMVIPILMLPLLIFGYVFRRSFKYFLITMRNSALLSLINKQDHASGKFFQYLNECRLLPIEIRVSLIICRYVGKCHLNVVIMITYLSSLQICSHFI